MTINQRALLHAVLAVIGFFGIVFLVTAAVLYVPKVLGMVIMVVLISLTIGTVAFQVSKGEQLYNNLGRKRRN